MSEVKNIPDSETPDWLSQVQRFSTPEPAEGDVVFSSEKIKAALAIIAAELDAQGKD